MLPGYGPLLLGGVVMALAIAASIVRSPNLSRAILAVPVLLILAINPLGLIALFHIIFEQGSSLRGGPPLLSAINAWLANIAGFALVYWYLDEIVPHSGRRVLLFPDEEENVPHNIIDFIYVATTTSLAFGPTDTPPADTLTRVAMLAEAMIAFVIVTMVAARAINAIG